MDIDSNEAMEIVLAGNRPKYKTIDNYEIDRLKLLNDELVQALKDIIEECLNPKLPYGMKVVEIAKIALVKTEVK